MNTFLKLDHVSKSYGSLPVLSQITARLEAPSIYCLSAPSGAGKTTLFRLILGLDKPDWGSIEYYPPSPRFSAVFQEDRLIDHLSPVDNVALVLDKNKTKDRINTGTRAEDLKRCSIYEELLLLLPEESLSRPVRTLSGGMKRRCAFLRAMMAPSDIVIMDEPFTGLDEDTKNKVIHYLLTHQRDRLFLIATHDREDIKKLGAAVIHLNGPQSSE